MIYGYVRVSTPQQSIDRQIRNIMKIYPQARVYAEAWTGTDMNRPEWQRLMRTVKDGDKIVFDSVSRMSRTSESGVETYKYLMGHGVSLEFIKEPHINSEVFLEARNKVKLPKIATGQEATDKLVRSIFDAIEDYVQALIEQQVRLAFEQAEKEVADLRIRTREGIETARLHGKQIGRPTGTGRTFTTDKEKRMVPLIEKMAKDFGGTLSDNECIQVLGLARGTYYRYKNRIKNRRC